MFESWRVAKHPEPVWADEADAVVLADISARGLVPRYESLPAAAQADGMFRIACIPFFVQDLALGDVVRVGQASGKRPPLIEEVEKASGRLVFRVWFGKSSDPLTRLECEERLGQLRALVEKQSENLFGVDAETEEIASGVFEFLDAQESESRLAFETGHTK